MVTHDVDSAEAYTCYQISPYLLYVISSDVNKTKFLRPRSRTKLEGCQFKTAKHSQAPGDGHCSETVFPR